MTSQIPFEPAKGVGQQKITIRLPIPQLRIFGYTLIPPPPLQLLFAYSDGLRRVTWVYVLFYLTFVLDKYSL